MCTRAKRKFVANATVPGVGVPQNKTFLLSLPIRRKEKMTLYDELVARGLIAQVTNEEEIKKFKPSLEAEEIEEAVYQEDLTDMTDLLKQVMDQKK